MPTYRFNNYISQMHFEEHFEGRELITQPAVKIAQDDSKGLIDFAYSDDLDSPRVLEPAIKIILKDDPRTFIYIDSKDVSI